MDSSANTVAASILLFHHCQAKKRTNLTREWSLTAARQAGLSIRDFAVALSSTRSLVGKVPAILGLVDAQRLKSAEKAFNAKFPFAHAVRHSIAHPELYSDPTKDMSMKGPFNVPAIGAMGDGSSLMLKDCIFGTTFRSTFEGRVVEFELTDKTIKTVNEVATESFESFSKLNPFSATRSI
jgi:hypothetical protein